MATNNDVFWSEGGNKSWTSHGSARSLICISNEALATKNRDVICITNIKSKVSTYYAVSNASVGFGVSIMAGHLNLPIFAFAEAVMCPAIRVLSYPNFACICQFSSPGVTKYDDMCFSKSEHLVALTSFPNYTIRVLNFRQNQILIELDTHRSCHMGALYCSHAHLPTIVQYSKWQKHLYVYDLCMMAEGFSLPEVSSIPLGKNQDESDLFNMCFWEDNTLYIVNDFGDVFSAETGLFYFKIQWYMKRETVATKPRAYIMQSCKRGLMVANTECIHLLSRKGEEWQQEFQILNVPNIIRKMVFDFNGNIYMSDSNTNLFEINAKEGEGVLTPIVSIRFKVNDFGVVQGVFKEVILFWLTNNELRLTDLRKMNIISQIIIHDITHLNTHNSQPFAIVGTKYGQVHIISYQKLREPVIVATVDLDTQKIETIKSFNNTIMCLDVYQTTHVISANFTTMRFFVVTRISKPRHEKPAFDSFLISEHQAIVFYCSIADDYWIDTDTFIFYEWSTEKQQKFEREYKLPYRYADVDLSLEETEGAMCLLYGVRSHDSIIDIFSYMSNGELIYTTCIQTHHRGYLTNISVSRDIITSSVSGSYICYHTFKTSKNTYEATVLLDLNFVPQVCSRIEGCFRAKYLVALFDDKTIKIQRLTTVLGEVKENIFLPVPDELRNIPVDNEEKHTLNFFKDNVKPPPTQFELEKRDTLLERFGLLSNKVRELIDYDISVIGNVKGSFRKFCLNLDWLTEVTNEAGILCEAERQSLLEAITDQTRIRDWIMNLLSSDAATFAYKIRGLFCNIECENYGLKKASASFDDELFNFHDMDPPNDELEVLIRKSNMDDMEEFEEVEQKRTNLYMLKGDSVYDHFTAKEFDLQATNEISFFQMHNIVVKFRLLNKPFKEEFNKLFNEVFELKEQIMQKILTTNGVLDKIYDNMNIMRRLLGMETFHKPQLSVPQWYNDESLEKILMVDDSEIKAINRRKKKIEIEIRKSARMLLWPLEFWERALMNMMDGVLEKFWEEEIKKDIPIPEFVNKKDPHEYTLAEQRQFLEYQELVRLLELDRRKYLRILARNEIKADNLKRSFILTLNRRIQELAQLKLKYDFALIACRLRIITTKITHFKRIQYQFKINMIRDDLQNLSEYVVKYNKLCEYWAKSVGDIKETLETLNNREKTMEKNFRSHFLVNIPEQCVSEMRKLYKKQPKLNKAVASVMIYDLIRTPLLKHKSVSFPSPKTVHDFLNAMEELDNPTNMPNILEPKHWDHFIRFRRQRIAENLKIKGTALELAHIQKTQENYIRNIAHVKSARSYVQRSHEKLLDEWMSILKNYQLVVVLTRGQVETTFFPRTASLKNSILIHIDDIHEINAKINAAGRLKLRAMQRVAVFRRQVIVKEWEHEVTKANISYLNYILEAIEKCRVSREFLNVLKNWEKEQEMNKMFFAPSLRSIENEVERKIKAAQNMLSRFVEKTYEVRAKIHAVKTKNVMIDKDIKNLQINIALSSVYRDDLDEEKRNRIRNERLKKIRAHHKLLQTVRQNHAHVLELKMILQLQRMRSSPMFASDENEIANSSTC